MIGNVLQGDEDARPFTIRRRDVGTYVDGIYEEQSPSLIVASGVIVPVRGETLLRLPEGSRSEESIQVFTQTELKTSRDENRQQADEIETQDGRLWKVTQIDSWNEVGAFFDVLAVLVPGVVADLEFVYIGTSASDLITSGAILSGLTPLPANDHTSEFEVTAAANQYIYYVFPISFGEEPLFEVNGFVGGFSMLDDSVIINSIDYQVYRSNHVGLGNTIVTVSEEEE